MTLPKFLLASADFNWVWVYRWLRPAKDARWTILRSLMLSALSGGLGALVGLLIGMGLFHQPVGWLPWLLGLWAACGELCWSLVTSICWNQRAELLRENPALPTALPRARFRFFRWCLGFVYFALLGIITPFALLVTVENIRGEIAWKRERARLVAVGERLTFREILGPEIPPEQNAGAAEVFAPFFDYEEHPVQRDQVHGGDINTVPKTVWSRSNELARIEQAFRFMDSALNKHTRQTERATTPAVNLEEWSATCREYATEAGTNPPVLEMPQVGNPAEDVLACLKPLQSLLVKMSTAAARPRSQFPVHYVEGFDAILRHVSILKAAQLALLRQCAAHLETGATDLAFADATNALDVAELLREEPLLISQLVRYAQLNIAVGTLWQGLAEHRWSVEQLQSFEQRIVRVDCLPGLVLAFEGERAANILSMERLIGDPRFQASFIGKPSPLRSLSKPLSRGLMRQNEVALVVYHTRNLIALRTGLDNKPAKGWISLVDDQQSDEFVMELARVYSPYRALAAMLAPALSKASLRFARTQTTLQLAIVVCGLERYRIAHGEFPVSLEALAGQFPDGVPMDPMVNQPFQYQRTDDGWFLLYSVGLNGTDDGGVMRLDDKRDNEEKDWPWPVPTRPAKVRLF